MAREDMRNVYHDEKPRYSVKPRKCLICKKRLSRYNLNAYCFVHALKGARIEQQEKAEQVHSLAKRKRDNETRKTRIESLDYPS